MTVGTPGSSSVYASVGRSVSGSSGEFSSDGRDTEHQSQATLHAFTDKASADVTASSEPKANKTRGFFDTLDWQTAGVTEATTSGTEHKKMDRVKQMAAFEVASTSLDEEFASFSANRLSTNTGVADDLSRPDVSDDDGSKGGAETATADLLGGSAWAGADAVQDLFDIGAPEPTNFDLLVGPQTLGNANGNSSSGADLLNSDQPFVADFGTFTESSNNPFDVPDASTVADNSALNDMAANLFGTFDPFTSASVDDKPVSSNKSSKADSQNTDFLAYMESSSDAGDDKHDVPDLMSGWNASNIFSGVNVSMPRPSSRPDFGSGTAGAHTDVPRASSSQNMSSKSFGMANGSTRSSKPADPFADIG